MHRLRSLRARITVGAVVAVAAALAVSGATLLHTVRSSLLEGVESAAEDRAYSLTQQLETAGPAGLQVGTDEDDDDEEPEDILWQVFDDDGDVLVSSARLSRPLPQVEGEIVRLPGGENPYLTERERAARGDDEYVVIVAVSLEDVDEAGAALLRPLVVGLPLLLVLLGAATWWIVGRALRPVEQIRAEVEQISGSSLDRRVSEPPSGDEVERLAHTMNQMLDRLHRARDRQQQFVSDASHELRSPLASIRQAAEVAHAYPGAMPEGEFAETVIEESIRLQALTDQLLALTKASDGHHQAVRVEVDLDDLALAEAQREVRAGLRVDTSGVAHGRVTGDPIALGQLVRNLIDNAARHARSAVAVSLTMSAAEVVLAVEDDGPGIPEPDRERVFERFVRLDEARARDTGGSGLGLAIVREVASSHAGAVSVDASPLGGARFTVRLPA